MEKKTVTQEQIDQIMKEAEYEIFHKVFNKHCIVVAKIYNGFTITGTAAVVDPKNYDEEIGMGIAIKEIEKKVWELEGYLLQNK